MVDLILKRCFVLICADLCRFLLFFIGLCWYLLISTRLCGFVLFWCSVGMYYFEATLPTSFLKHCTDL